jgi:peptidyl-prolyl cis-trans isomerase SurA
MVIHSMMRLFAVLLGLLVASAPVSAQLKLQKKEATLFTVKGKPVSTDEFTRLYKKNAFNKNEAASQEAVEEYLQLLINFKLKIAEAYSRGLDATPKFSNEFKTYQEELKKPYRTEPDALDLLAKQTYQRLTEEVKASHILINAKPEDAPADTLKAYNKIVSIRSRILAGEDFEKVAAEVSEDPSAKYNYGNLGYFTALQMVYQFEDAAYNTKTGDLSPIIRTQFGYHLIKVFDRKPARGEVEVSHILLRGASPDDKNVKNKIFEIYDQLRAGRNWDEVCKEYSEDTGTKNSGGRLRPFGVGALASVPEFESRAFAMQKPGEISDPFESNIGWHIIRLERKIPLMPYNEMEASLKRRLGRDERLQLSKKELSEKRRKEYHFTEVPEVKEKVFALVDTSLTKGTWSYKGTAELKSQQLFSVENRKISVADFINYINTNQTKVSQAPLAYMQQLYDAFVEDNIMIAENERLEREHPEFKFTLNEYREGILLFDIMESEVWNKASQDTAGQRNYYEKNQQKYQGGDRVEARIFAATDRSVIESTINKVNTGDSLSNADLKKFKSIQPYRIYERKDSKVIDRITWTIGLHELELEGQFYLVEIKRLVPPGVKSFEEARASVISDYQDYLEKEWLVSLQKKFPVKVNNKGKKMVLAELTGGK